MNPKITSRPVGLILGRLLTVLMVICLALLALGSIIAATYKNDYSRVQVLVQDSARIPDAVRKARTDEVISRLRNRYESLTFLSFKEDTTYYWCDKAWKVRLPMSWWTSRKECHVEMSMTPTTLRTEISAYDGAVPKPLYVLFSNPTTFTEFKYPWNGVPGQKTSYPTDSRNFHLTQGVSGFLMCETGLYRRSWLGTRSHQVMAWVHNMMKPGSWVGTVTLNEGPCDVVYLGPGSYRIVTSEGVAFEDVLTTTENILYVDKRGFVVRWDQSRINETTEEGKKNYRFISTKRYYDFDTTGSESRGFSPSKALLRDSETWQAVKGGDDE